MQKIIDPHLHLFDLKKGKYAWLLPNKPPMWPDKALIRRDFNLCDVSLNNDINLAGAVHIEAGFDNQQPQNELNWLENHVFTHDIALPYKAIAFANILLAPDVFTKQINALQKYNSLIGVRFIFDENSYEVSDFRNISANLGEINARGLCFEFQCDFTNTALIEAFYEVFATLKNLKVTISHAGFAPIHSTENKRIWHVWFSNMEKFASLANVNVKCSGFEMMLRDYGQHHMQGVIEKVVLLFSEKRVMMASNFPLTLFKLSYLQYWQLTIASVQAAGINTNALVHDNAQAFYFAK